MDFVFVAGGEFELGWRFELPPALRADPEAQAAADDYVSMCSPKRLARVGGFEIAREPIQLAELLGDPYALEISDLHSLCELLDSRLESQRLRVPTEDELEVAAGGTLFPWGELIPDGIPYGAQTSFATHKQPNARGLRLLADPYKTEVSRTALKFGDGGTAICGGEPWPLAWLAMSNCFRLTDREISECFRETLEEAFVRPVRRT